jgi:hypothetical protein
MDDVRSLRATCRFMRGVCDDLEVGQCIALERFADNMVWYDPNG